jgi:hypothetical protein
VQIAHEVVQAGVNLRPSGRPGRWPHKTLAFLVCCDLWQPDRAAQRQLWSWLQTPPAPNSRLEETRQVYREALPLLRQAVTMAITDSALALLGEIQETCELLVEIGVATKHPDGAYSLARPQAS